MDEAAAECVRCQRSDADHQARDAGEADEIAVRIWRALGPPCAEFTLTPVTVYARNQAATGRWSRRPQPARPLAASSSGPPATAHDGAELVRQALARRNERRAS